MINKNRFICVLFCYFDIKGIKESKYFVWIVLFLVIVYLKFYLREYLNILDSFTSTT